MDSSRYIRPIQHWGWILQTLRTLHNSGGHEGDIKRNLWDGEAVRSSILVNKSSCSNWSGILALVQMSFCLVVAQLSPCTMDSALALLNLQNLKPETLYPIYPACDVNIRGSRTTQLHHCPVCGGRSEPGSEGRPRWVKANT